MANPVAPITDHFLDATHVSLGVITLGFVARGEAKVEASAFTGGELIKVVKCLPRAWLDATPVITGARPVHTANQLEDPRT